MTLIIIFIVLVCLYQIQSYSRMYKYVAGELVKPPGKYFPKAAVILPCKGLDPGFKENLNKLIAQDYGIAPGLPGATETANFEIIFTVAGSDDPAYPILQEVIDKNPHVNAKLVLPA